MTLEQVTRLLRCSPVDETAVHGDALCAVVESVTEDSRRVVPGSVFVAVRGEHVDGHNYIAQAIEAGAVAVISERSGLSMPAETPYFVVPNARRALGVLAHALADHPSKAMRVTGVTGTNGKSSTIALVHRTLEKAGKSAAAFGTLGYVVGGELLPAARTTPFGEELADMFARARDAGNSHAVMEVSSHALEQDRVAGIEFDVAAFTNLTQDHLDYHPDMDAYRRAKLLLFERISGPDGFTVVNVDDPSGPAFIDASQVPCYTYGAGGDCRAVAVETGVSRTRFTVETPWGTAAIEMRLLGHHNVSNALCTVAVCGGLGLPLDAIARGIGSLECVPGRFEHVDAGQPYQVVVDYAHTEDGLRNVLRAARAICSGKVITVFGCGGDRDKGKRPKMAAAVAELGDLAIITSDNPRTEDPGQILLDVEAGMAGTGKSEREDYWKVLDRAEAIRRGIALAEPGDLVLIAGKGHEDYQILGAETIHFDDREVARAVLEERQAS